MDTPWKKTERAIAKRLGGVRIPVASNGPDVDAPAFACEVKLRRHLPSWIEAALRQAERRARKGQTPIVVLHRYRDRYDQAVVFLTLRDFEAWCGASADGSDASQP